MQDNYIYHKLVDQTIPQRLQNIDSPPKQLFYVGADPNFLLNDPAVSIVGSRKPSPYGREVTSSLTHDLTNYGVLIISGLALGVDSIAHQACLDNGGKTIAVLPCGPDKIYPATHRHLAKQIINSGGALITEYPENTPPLRQNFIARNRLVSALGDVIIITEAAEKSGTLHTANFALNQGKTVMVVPGPITSPLSIGTNRLIKSGALPITSAKDILEQIGIDDNAGEPKKIIASNPQELAILKLLNQGVRDGQALMQESKLDPVIFNQTLTMLEINQQIKPLGNNKWQLN